MADPVTLAIGGASLPGFDDRRHMNDRDDDEHKNSRRWRTRIEDVNGDGRLDMLVELRVDRLRLNQQDIVADVWGRTRRGIPFSGTDFVQVVR